MTRPAPVAPAPAPTTSAAPPQPTSPAIHTSTPTPPPAPTVEIGPQPPPPPAISTAPPPPADPLPPAPAAAAGSGPHAAVLEDADDPKKRFEHRGIVIGARVGTQGCLGTMCRGGRHDVSPGVRVGGFLGGNIRGWVEMGLGGGWGTLRPQVEPGTNALLLYGLNPTVLSQALQAQAAGLINVNLAGLAVSDASMRVAQAGPRLRIHLLPRGRVGAFVGSGVGYHRLRSRYETAIGPLGLDFHGIEVPVEANLSVYVLPRLAVGVQFDYSWTWYGLAVLDHPQQRVAMPMGVLQLAAQQQSVDLRGELPQMWNLGLALRGRL